MSINVKDVRRYISCPKHLGGAPSFDAPLPVTVDGYVMWEVQALLSMRTNKRTRCKEALVLCQRIMLYKNKQLPSLRSRMTIQSIFDRSLMTGGTSLAQQQTAGEGNLPRPQITAGNTFCAFDYFL
jgi:hypothetical protein